MENKREKNKPFLPLKTRDYLKITSGKDSSFKRRKVGPLSNITATQPN